MTQALPSLLLLIPAYNEENRIGPVLREYALHFRQHYPGRAQIVGTQRLTAPPPYPACPRPAGTVSA